MLSIGNNNLYARQYFWFVLAAGIVRIVSMSTKFRISKWHSIVKMKSLSHPRLINQALKRIGKFRAFGLDQVTILEAGTSKRQMTNGGEHRKVTNEFLLWLLPMCGSSITAIVRITRRQEVPVNPQIRLDVHVVIVRIANGVSFLLKEALFQVGKIPTNEIERRKKKEK
jgi:hypothetical protein